VRKALQKAMFSPLLVVQVCAGETLERVGADLENGLNRCKMWNVWKS
jgi:hypothetical protein